MSKTSKDEHLGVDNEDDDLVVKHVTIQDNPYFTERFCHQSKHNFFFVF